MDGGTERRLLPNQFLEGQSKGVEYFGLGAAVLVGVWHPIEVTDAIGKLFVILYFVERRLFDSEVFAC